MDHTMAPWGNNAAYLQSEDQQMMQVCLPICIYANFVFQEFQFQLETDSIAYLF